MALIEIQQIAFWGCLCESLLIQVSKCYKDGVTLIVMKILREMISNEWFLS